MERTSTFLLRIAATLIGTVVLILCAYVLPSGLIKGADDFTPIIIGMYVTAVPFYFALYQTFKLLDYIDESKAFSTLSVNALRYIKHSAIAISAVYVAGLPYIYHVADRGDAPGILALALVVVFASAVIAVFAATLQKLLRSAIAIKSESELTV